VTRIGATEDAPFRIRFCYSRIANGYSTGGEIAETAAVRAYIAGEFRAFLEPQPFWMLSPDVSAPDPASQQRLPILKGRITQISSL
jgi:hypothetical protein